MPIEREMKLQSAIWQTFRFPIDEQLFKTHELH